MAFLRAATKDRVSCVRVPNVSKQSVGQVVLNPSRIRKVPGQMGVSRQMTTQSEINSAFQRLSQVHLVTHLE